MMFSLVQSSCSVMSKSLQPHGLQHTRLPCSSPTPRTYSKPRPLTQWCHPTISSSVVPFSSLLQSFPASGSFQMSQLFPSGGQSIGVLASTSDLPMNIQDWFPLGLTGWISLQSKGLSRVFFFKKESSPIPQFKSISSFRCSAFFIVELSHPYMTTGKTIALNEQTFVGKVISAFLIYCLDGSQLFFQGASFFSFCGFSHHLQCFWSPPKIKSLSVFIVTPSICHEWWDQMPWS